MSGDEKPDSESSAEPASEEREAAAQEPISDDGTKDEEPAEEDVEEGVTSLDELVAAIDGEAAGGDATAAPALLPAGATSFGSLGARYIIFSLADTRYAVRVGQVVEIAPVPALTPLPRVPPWVRGVTNLRGEILAVVDLRGFLGLEPAAQTAAGRILVTRAGDEELTAALVVDAVNGVTSLAEEELLPPTSPMENRITPYLLGVREHEERLLAVLDLEKLLLSPELRRFEAL